MDKLKKIVLIGTTTQNNKVVNGQSMMFQLFVDKLQEKGVKTKIVDFGRSFDKDSRSKRVSGKFSITKLIDNFVILFQFLFVALSNIGAPMYINTSQSKVGFLRDYIYINFAHFLGYKIYAHQFGSNYKKFYDSQNENFQQKIRKTFEKTTQIIVEGEYTKQQFSFLPDYQSKVISIPNGLPEKIECKNITSKNIENNPPIKLLYLSNLIESKGFWDVLEAANILVNRDKREVEVIFSGKFLADVEDVRFTKPDLARQAFFKYIQDHHLKNRITYFEGLYGEEKSVAFTKCHFFLLPSYYINEGQPVSIVEALAYGCVPIVTNYRLIPSMVNTENGFFVEPKSPEKIAEVINKMIDNPIEYQKYSKTGISYFQENFTANQYFNRLLNVMHS